MPPTSAQLVNPVKERMQAGEVALGMIVRLAHSGEIARIAKTTDHDFLFIDGQHALFSTETIGHIAQTALGCGVAPFVRVRGCHDPDIQVLLDNGVLGIIVPDVNTAADARRAVDAAKFPPLGKRSVAGGYPYFNYAAVPADQALKAINGATLVACMIETVEGLANVDEIAAVDGVDVLHVGSGDLLTTMGKPGQFGIPEHIAAVEKVLEVAARHGKICGLGGERDPDRQVEFIRKGVRFLTTQSDAGLLMIEASRRSAGLRAATGKAAARG